MSGFARRGGAIMTCRGTPLPAREEMSSIASHESCPTSFCDSCFGLIYDDGYSSNGEELDEDDEHYEDYGDEDDEDDDMGDEDEGSSCRNQFQTQSQASAATSSVCQSQVTDPFSMSSMSSFFGGPSSSFSTLYHQRPFQGFSLGAPSPSARPPAPAPPFPSLAPRSSNKRKRSQHSQRCSCQKNSKGLWNIPSTAGPPHSGPFSGNINGRNMSHSQATTGTGTESQLSIFSNSTSYNGQSQTNTSKGFGTQAQVPTQTDSNQTLSQLLVTNGRGKDKNGMIKNLNVYNPNITIQVTPENFNKFNKFFVPKSGNRNGNNGAHS